MYLGNTTSEDWERISTLHLHICVDRRQGRQVISLLQMMRSHKSRFHRSRRFLLNDPSHFQSLPAWKKGKLESQQWVLKLRSSFSVVILFLGDQQEAFACCSELWQLQMWMMYLCCMSFVCLPFHCCPLRTIHVCIPAIAYSSERYLVKNCKIGCEIEIYMFHLSSSFMECEKKTRKRTDAELAVEFHLVNSGFWRAEGLAVKFATEGDTQECSISNTFISNTPRTSL